MNGLPPAYAKVLNVGAWPQRYNATLGRPQAFNGHADYVLDLTPKQGGSDRGVAFVDPISRSVDQVKWDLSGGIQPYATADGTATMNDYAVNVPIEEGVFSKQ
jgi:hypothetical protein